MENFTEAFIENNILKQQSLNLYPNSLSNAFIKIKCKIKFSEIILNPNMITWLVEISTVFLERSTNFEI